ncbi:MAG: A/G-specific adenine glycosylase [Acidobacteriota bacterium]
MGYTRDLTPIAARLLSWYRASGRDLPWRRDRDPYRVWVSEAMLQQTTVKAVIPYYERFVARFPDVAALHAASMDDVLASWAGLGYYRRARHLKAAAEAIVRDHGGRLPARIEDLRALPGFGPYMSAAVAAIAFDAPSPPIDANLRRVAARFFAISPREKPVDARAEVALGPLYAIGPPSDLTQALMDLGATVCLPVEPRCSTCPVSFACRGRRAWRLFGRAPARPLSVTRHAAALLWVDRGHVLLRQGTSRHLEGLWDLPVAEAATLPAALAKLRRTLPEGWPLGGWASVASLRRPELVVRHSIMARRITRHVFRCERRRSGPGDWLPFERLPALALTSAAKKTLRAALSSVAWSDS